MKALEGGGLLGEYQNPSERYAGQVVKVVEMNGYAFVVPCIEGEEEVLLKTAYPSRRRRSDTSGGK